MPYREHLQSLRVLHSYSCGYCGVTEADAGSILTIDHYIPPGFGGTGDLDNLVYSCPTCNRRKGAYVPSEKDNEAGRRILHPRHDDLTLHLRETPDGQVVGLTSAGEFHVSRLDLNRAPLLAHRQRRQIFSELKTQVATHEEMLGQILSQLQPLLDEVQAMGGVHVKDLEANIEALRRLLKALRESLP